MTNIYQFQPESQIYDDASLWIARLDRGLSKEETEALRLWLDKSPKHRECLLEMADLWDRMDSLSMLAELFDPPAATKNRNRQRSVWAVAASVTALVCAIGLLAPAERWKTPAAEVQPLQTAAVTPNNVYETGIGAHSTVNLPDGTRMLLNTDTQVTVTYTDNERLLELKKGELHVEVAHDKQRPLRVMVGGKIVEAVGTAFNVYRKDDQNFDVIVTEGRVHVKPVADRLTIPTEVENLQELGRGEKLSVRASQPVEVKPIETAVISDRLSWRDGNVVFRGESLQNALDELSRYTPETFKVIDPRITDVRIAGLYKAGDIESLLLALKENFNIDHARTAGGVIELSLHQDNTNSD
ncbi:FecR family protein [Cellvibrio polysaccharolyticus]|uniref:Transmembrane sensor n=1 Tax=Cellvibrio polysaccharolyticus TaxID=2082724 RepID=A0A928V213_9GAMM|nr:FecR domain-containing protein [Cellvibrio polysaccharolyticus]MBE8716358.1 transmembrane sensor [Cellvibrio polysaccharolyticus]